MALFNIPLPKTVADVKAGGGLFTAYNAINKAGLENAKNALANQYYGPKTNAEIAQHLAHAGLMGSEQQKNAFQIANPQYMNPEGFLYTQAAKEQAQQQQNGNGGTPSANTNAINMPSAPVSNSVRDIGGMPGSPVNPQTGNLPPVTAPEPGTQASSNATDNSLMSLPAINMPNGGGMFSNLFHQRLDPAGTTTGIHQSNAVYDLNQKLLGDASDEAEKSVSTSYALDSLGAARDKLRSAEKGPIIGRGKAITSAAQQYDRANAQIRNDNGRALNTGHITNSDFQYADQVSANREMNDAAFKTYLDFTKALQDRKREKAPFYQKAASMGVPPSVYRSLWTRYINERPVYDYQADKPIDGNLASWPKYLTDEAYTAVQRGKPFAPNVSLGKEKKEEKTPESTGAFDADKFLNQKFKSADEFNNALDSYSPEIRKQILDKMPRRKK